MELDNLKRAKEAEARRAPLTSIVIVLCLIGLASCVVSLIWDSRKEYLLSEYEYIVTKKEYSVNQHGNPMWVLYTSKNNEGSPEQLRWVNGAVWSNYAIGDHWTCPSKKHQ